MNSKFASLNISDSYVRALNAQNITEPTPIQQEAIPPIAEGNDVIAQSQTGTGKTLVYLLPIMQKLDAQSKELQALVLVPTRELGMQILREIEALGAAHGIRGQALIGGAAVQRQVEKLRLHPHIVVGTPGRIVELIKLRKLKMHQVKTIVVDEVDQVFDLGSMNEVEDIFKSALRDCQIVLLSATIPAAINEVAERWLKNPTRVAIEPGQRTAESIEHMYFISEERDKIDVLRRLVRLLRPTSAIVFINETNDMGELSAKLKYVGFSIEALYGDMDKQARSVVLNGFRSGKFQLLLATDVAARGLDIKGLSHVINYDPPVDADHYVHRVGRTGRMGAKGTAVSIITPKEKFIIEKFSKQLGISIVHKAMLEGRLVNPDEYEAAMSRKRVVTRPKGAAPSPSAVSKAKINRERDRKNKGAPKWLKDKIKKD
jgi:ATP-dependent RNA helicase DeaD